MAHVDNALGIAYEAGRAVGMVVVAALELLDDVSPAVEAGLVNAERPAKSGD